MYYLLLQLHGFLARTTRKSFGLRTGYPAETVACCWLADSLFNVKYRSRPRDNSEAYRFTASRAEEAEHKDLHTSRYDMCRHDARHKIEERRRSRPDQDLSSRRVHKEPPRDWQPRRNRSPTSGSQIHIVAG
ncbi:hypothetical protein DY000_02047322 [Brassica cretica]|uniref:Uncharacterized protein n=1 Tax=Brassica cretica TaxID=69181 RepID=A0ABQ7EUM3_BRACR|nr:hypothetical protein DY000_02047322 [Brassica cretica]